MPHTRDTPNYARLKNRLKLNELSKKQAAGVKVKSQKQNSSRPGYKEKNNEQTSESLEKSKEI